MQGSPAARMQSGNLFAFVMNNPIMWTDPTGLFATNVNYSRFATGRPMTLPTANAPRSSSSATSIPPITVTQTGNNVHIEAVVNIWGTGADLPVSNHNLPNNLRGINITHRQAAVNGIIINWGGHRDGLNVTVGITDIGIGTHLLRYGQRHLSVEIRDGFDTSHFEQSANGWSVADPGGIVLYTGFANGRLRTLQDVRWTAAHEFGHALGIEDGWGFGVAGRGWEATELGNATSIMTQRNQSATRLDIELALKSHRTNTWQAWHSNPLVINHIRPLVTHGNLR